jgi:hypothetical protein
LVISFQAAVYQNITRNINKYFILLRSVCYGKNKRTFAAFKNQAFI